MSEKLVLYHSFYKILTKGCYTFEAQLNSRRSNDFPDKKENLIVLFELLVNNVVKHRLSSSFISFFSYKTRNSLSANLLVNDTVTLRYRIVLEEEFNSIDCLKLVNFVSFLDINIDLLFKIKSFKAHFVAAVDKCSLCLKYDCQKSFVQQNIVLNLNGYAIKKTKMFGLPPTVISP